MSSSPPLEIRTYLADVDYDPCRALWVELTERHREIYEDPTIGGDDPGGGLDGHLARHDLVELWVAERDGEIVGMTGLCVGVYDEAEVEPIVVTRRLRSSGIGRALLEHVIAEARERGLGRLSIKPVARNVDAIRLFHDVGFRMLGHVDLSIRLDGTDPGDVPRLRIHGLEFDY